MAMFIIRKMGISETRFIQLICITLEGPSWEERNRTGQGKNKRGGMGREGGKGSELEKLGNFDATGLMRGIRLPLV